MQNIAKFAYTSKTIEMRTETSTKRHFLPFLMVFFSLISFGQNNEMPHLTYKGIPITGSKEHFERELTRKGFSLADQTPEKQLVKIKNSYIGEFASYPAQAAIKTTPLTNTIYCVQTYLTPHSKWEEVLEDYSTFKYHLEGVYGKAKTSKEEFLLPYCKGDGFEMKAVAEEKVNYFSFWELKNGEIKISIIENSKKAVLLIEYIDKKNTELKTEERTAIIRKDL